MEATEFPDLARRYRISAVPKTVVNAEGEIMGALPPDAFIQQVLELARPAPQQPEEQPKA